MRTSLAAFLTLLCVAVPASTYAQQAATAQLPSVPDIVSRMKQSESTLVTNMQQWKPVIEVYIQNLETDPQLGFVPTQDTYFLGRFDWANGPKMQTLNGTKEQAKQRADTMKTSGLEFLPDGFAATAVPDWQQLDPSRYDFTLVRREFLGEARTYVLDVKPLKDENEGFSGRIWVEDLGYNIVRYNGINRRVERSLFRKKIPVHVDGWRTNVLPGLWLPSYAYVEETDLQGTGGRSKTARFKSQVKFWGFDPRRAKGTGQLTGIEIAEPSVQDLAEPKQLSPIESQRRWEQEAETNVIERLGKASLLAPAGDVEKILETVINNLLVTNNIELETQVKARILLTSPLESFTIGHTIVLSRGLIDVLPDEATLAMMLAHELSHIVLGHQLIDTQFAYADRLMVGDDDLLRTLKVQRAPEQEAAADARVVEMLDKSPYKDKLTDAGLFLRTVAAHAKELPNLIQPHIGDRLANNGGQSRFASVMANAPELDQGKLDQIPALPLGARLVIDPWTSRLELSRAATPPLRSVREKVPFAVTPLIPFPTYAKVEAPATPAAPTPAAAPVPASTTPAPAAPPQPAATPAPPVAAPTATTVPTASADAVSELLVAATPAPEPEPPTPAVALVTSRATAAKPVATGAKRAAAAKPATKTAAPQHAKAHTTRKSPPRAKATF